MSARKPLRQTNLQIGVLDGRPKRLVLEQLQIANGGGRMGQKLGVFGFLPVEQVFEVAGKLVGVAVLVRFLAVAGVWRVEQVVEIGAEVLEVRWVRQTGDKLQFHRETGDGSVGRWWDGQARFHG